MEQNYDIVIIGSGLGSLECAAMLSKEGYNVCVLEKNVLFGGCFQTYRRCGHLLDTGIHYVGSLEDGQVMHQYFKYFGIMDRLHVRKLDEDAFDIIRMDDREFPFACGHEHFVEALARHFPEEREGLRTYMQSLRRIGDLIHPDLLRQGIIARNGMEYFATSASGEVERCIKSPLLRNVLAGSSLLYGGEYDASTFYHHAMINNSYIEGAYRFVNGSMQVAERLIEVIRANGGTVLNRQQVTRIVVKDEQVTGVEVNGTDFIPARYVISGIHPRNTMEILDQTPRIKRAYRSRIATLPNTYGIFTMYLLFRDGDMPYFNSNIYLHDNGKAWYDRSDIGSTHHCLISMSPVAGASYANTVSVLTPMFIDEVAAWSDTQPEQRGAGYLDFKARKEEQLLCLMAAQGYKFEHVEAVYSTTPLSYRDYTGTVDGSAYGIVKNYKCPQIGFVSHQTKVKNLLLTGQNLNIHGALGVTLTAALTCAQLVGQEYLARKIGNA